MANYSYDVAVIGGGGHVGLPLALVFADNGLRTVIYDIDSRRVGMICEGTMPFREDGADEILRRVLTRGTLTVDDTPRLLPECRFLVLIVGTPVDEHLNPSFTAIHRALEQCLGHLHDGQLLVLRSTVFPGITRHIRRFLEDKNLRIDVVFCPERVAQGNSIREFHILPQIVGADDPALFAPIRELFGRFTPDFIEMNTMEAELCKLMTNAWRYIQFAIVNQFYMIASANGLDFDKVLHGCRHKYPRMAGVPGPGLAAGPCLVKDTMQLAAFSRNSFPLGHAAMVINESLPSHLVALTRQQTSLKDKTVGILGMAFKAESDDPRDSLSYKLRKLLVLEARQVLCTDPYVRREELVPLENVLAEADVVFIATPHSAYRGLTFRDNQLVVDVWNCTGPKA